ncbi:hypothetical protein CRENBAI_022117 [Crenichthys baileyi]|uniref:Uncharacterized protein n=1 Tax=Crenichthys baileyi TaxID=28760 RepID=A0AAV9SGT4_9TELE
MFGVDHGVSNGERDWAHGGLVLQPSLGLPQQAGLQYSFPLSFWPLWRANACSTGWGSYSLGLVWVPCCRSDPSPGMACVGRDVRAGGVGGLGVLLCASLAWGVLPLICCGPTSVSGA